VIWGELGKNKDTLEAATLPGLDALCPLPVTWPSTSARRIRRTAPPAGRQALKELLHAVALERQTLRPGLPVLVKLSPDLSDVELDDAVDVILSTGMDGVIATNTTVSRPVAASRLAGETGGLSGAPLGDLSTEIVRKIVHRTGGILPVVAVGGVMDAAGARRKLEAGAVLVQVYTGLIYAGPALVKEILDGLGD
jgi:dihydroorotate dehydrogenase